MKVLVLGGGLQGSACAFDLLQHADVEQVRLADRHADKLPHFLAPFSGERLIPTMLDATNHEAVRALMGECDVVACALPYYFNYDAARLALEAGAHFCDLGGNTGIVTRQKELHEQARSKRTSIIPDCGLAPGTVNILAQRAIDDLDTVSSVKMLVGGLPQNPEPPLNYQIVYSIEGMLDYYTTQSWILRDGKRTQIDALSEIEEVRFPQPLGALEAFHTAGGLSTMGFRYEGRIPSMEYKTLRYPGHAQIMKAIRDLGLLDTESVDVHGMRVKPRDIFIATAGERLRKPHGLDLVALRVIATGTRGGTPAQTEFEIVDMYDAKNGISAMMRTTGYSLSITALLQGRGRITNLGVHTPDECVPAEEFIAELSSRGIRVRISRV